MTKYLEKTLIVTAVIAILITAWNLMPISFKQHFVPGAPDDIVVVDMLRLDVAQRRFVADLLAENPGASGIASAFRATRDVVAAAKAVAPGKSVMVKQAFLYTDYPDITDEVLVELGLDPSVDLSINSDILSEKIEVPKQGEAVREHRESSGSAGVALPY